jgi:lysozyme family protein
MATFEDAYKKVVKSEGSYVHDSDDSGGETYKGISRRYNPQWEGWAIVDNYKKSYRGKPLSKVLDADDRLEDMVKELYKNNYWDVFELDNIPSQLIAYQMFDTCVNCGPAAAVRAAQKSLGERITGRWSFDLLTKLAAIHS